MYKLAVGAGAVVVLAALLGQSASNKRAYVAGHFALELDGAAGGFLRSCEGGGVKSEVIEEPPTGVGRPIKKHIAGVKYEDFGITCGTGMSKGFYDWIKASFEHQFKRQDGSIVAADFDYQELSRLDFSKALITEVGMPALDAASKDACKMTIKFKPETTRKALGSGREIPRSKVQKQWLPANFRLKIDGLDEPCKRVNKIEALTVKQKVVEDPVGDGQYEVPNLVITFPESAAKPFYDWHEDFVIKGNNGDDKEKGGTLEYLTPDLKDVLFTVTFQGLGIFKVSPDKAEAGAEGIRRIKAEMYCEEMKLDYSTGVIGR